MSRLSPDVRLLCRHWLTRSPAQLPWHRTIWTNQSTRHLISASQEVTLMCSWSSLKRMASKKRQNRSDSIVKLTGLKTRRLTLKMGFKLILHCCPSDMPFGDELLLLLLSLTAEGNQSLGITLLITFVSTCSDFNWLLFFSLQLPISQLLVYHNPASIWMVLWTNRVSAFPTVVLLPWLQVKLPWQTLWQHQQWKT